MVELKTDVQDLHKSYGDNEVLKGITIQLHEGDVVCIIGPLGSGKSTLPRTLNSLEIITSEKAIIGGYELSGPKIDVDKVREDIGMAFQHSNFFPHMTVPENITFASIELGKESKEETEKHAMELLEQVGLADKCDAKPESLLGGQKQCVAIAHSLATDPDIMPSDKPISALDPEMVGDILNVMKNLVEQSMTMLVVIHETGFARKVANRAIFTDGGEFLENGTPEQIFDNPQHPRLEDFLGKVLNV